MLKVDERAATRLGCGSEELAALLKPVAVVALDFGLERNVVLRLPGDTLSSIVWRC